MSKSKTVAMLLIDPQNSLCKVVAAKHQQKIHDGELCVPGAWEDMARVARLIGRLGRKLSDIHITLNSRQFLHISHPAWFRDAQGRNPEPLTIMRENQGTIIGSRIGIDGKPYDVGVYTTTISWVLQRTLEYLKGLAEGKRYPHCIWPPHCLIGTPGYGIAAPVMQALLDWCGKRLASLSFHCRNSNPFVEQFSAVRAEIPDPDDPTTQLNACMIQTLMEADEVLVAGEPGSHTLANTITDIGYSFADDSFFRKCILVTDGTSPVPGFEHYQTFSVTQMQAHGMRTTTCADYCT